MILDLHDKLNFGVEVTKPEYKRYPELEKNLLIIRIKIPHVNPMSEMNV
jgi:hypothetical protein